MKQHCLFGPIMEPIKKMMRKFVNHCQPFIKLSLQMTSQKCVNYWWITPN